MRKKSDVQKNTVIILKFDQCGFTTSSQAKGTKFTSLLTRAEGTKWTWYPWLAKMLLPLSPWDAEGMANSVDLDQRSDCYFRNSLIWVWTICPGQSVRKLRLITLINPLTASEIYYPCELDKSKGCLMYFYIFIIQANCRPLNMHWIIIMSEEFFILIELGHDKPYKMTCAPNEDLHQSRHLHKEALSPWLCIKCTA